MATIDEKKDPIGLVEGGVLDEMDEEARRHAELEAKLNKDLDEKILSNPNSFPKAVFFIIPNEMGERFCFYGINPLLKDYLKEFVGYKSNKAEAMVHVYKSVTYFFPLVGAAISDSFLDKYKTIVSLSTFYLLGVSLLAIFSKPGVIGTPPTVPEWGPLLGLFLIAFGTGGIKPCVSSHGGDQFLSVQKLELNKFYNYFYMSINVGAVAAGFITPAIKNRSCYDLAGGKDCYAWAFGVYRPFPIPKNALTNGFNHEKAKAAASESQGETNVIELFDLLRVIMVISPAPFFWMAFDQNNTSWQSLTDQMNRSVWPSSETINAVMNPLLIVILAPIWANFIYPAIERRVQFGLLRRMVVGMILCGLAFIVCGIIQNRVSSNCVVREFTNAGVTSTECIDDGISTPIFIIPYFIMTTGEILFSISGLNFTYMEVGKRTKSSCAALWLLGTALGNVFATALFESPIGDTDHTGRAKFFYINAGICFGASILQMFLNRFYVYKADR
ncbi:uncharacterized protein SPPG_09544 [Spizellomyces punctatus DAOM BR117]|uniref:Amino acid/peptide transporter (Peptide:H+ symporter) n=1 Tax=Spizellomyces punctatus (strain DAOM BR117) TaxID=645134 RepID=A0A0L0H5X2_SPIPD|nr:uncharacterized protein SPPG_09544 [Spizellomyces punctatus DAOM BR117]KNC96098.1 hypothetical protein SPPG_09544 [Spizellomyces punctatus DAOM BR117]|eukprot:XP_016604138.1 hypothetical protein SPPG_09544 [Spizellomyces punctatus DAOM BR117]